MNKFQGGGNINDVIHIFAATGAKHHQGHGWPGAFPTCPNKIIPDITQQLFTGLEELSQPFFNLLKLGGDAVLWRKGSWLREAGFGRHITLKSVNIPSDPS